MPIIEAIWINLSTIGGLREFLELGGPVMGLILVLSFFLWTLIVERIWYFGFAVKADHDDLQTQWSQRKDYTSWTARRIREAFISKMRVRCFESLGIIKALVAITPLMGLLGTVTGMIEVFDVLAITGASNARAMAAGVSRAILPTMAGMVVALSGIYAAATIERWAQKNIRQCEENLIGE